MIIFIFIYSLTFGVMEISVMMTQLSSGIAAKSSSKDLEEDKMNSQRTQKKLKSWQKHPQQNISMLLFFLMLNICLFLLFF